MKTQREAESANPEDAERSKSKAQAGDSATDAGAASREPQGAAEPDPTKGRIGRDKCAVRVLNFAGGGFDTVMQLGVAHALLVIQGRAPDAVVGLSAGAVNAVALAEILQAGEEIELPQKRMQARVSRFREIFSAYQRAPGEIKTVLIPDTYQIDYQRPLQPVELPIHVRQERESRQRAAASRSGLVNLYNELLEVRLSLGALTRATRRLLGFQATGDIRNPFGKRLAQTMEVARSWLLLGRNLHWAAPLIPPLLTPLFRKRPRKQKAGTAGTLIFLSPVWMWIGKSLSHAVWFLVLLTLWVGLSVLVVGLPFLLAKIIAVFIPVLGDLTGVAVLNTVGRFVDEHFFWSSMVIYAAIALGLVAPLVVRGWEAFLAFNRATTRSILGELALGVAGLSFWFVIWGIVSLILPTFALFLALPEFRAEGVAGFWALIPFGWSLLLHLFWWGSLVLVVAVILVRIMKPWRGYIRNILARYSLDSSLFDAQPAKDVFVQLFDKAYYGTQKIDDVVERALRDDLSPAETPECTGRLLRHYAEDKRLEPIYVGVAVADVESGTLTVVNDYVKVVDALLAATAVTPIFPPQQIGPHLYVDASNITNDPMRASLNMLRERINRESTIVHIYSVSPLPCSRLSIKKDEARSVEEGSQEGPVVNPKAVVTAPSAADVKISRQVEEPKPKRKRKEGKGDLLVSWNLVDVVVEARNLERFRDAVLERRLTQLFTRALPPGRVRPVKDGPVRAWVTPIEPEAALEVNERFFKAETRMKRHDLIARTVADGCRAALEVMIGQSYKDANREKEEAARKAVNGKASEAPDREKEPAALAPCWEAVKSHFNERAKRSSAKQDNGIHTAIELPGSREDSGPGVVEVCRHCAIREALDNRENAEEEEKEEKEENEEKEEKVIARCSLMFDQSKEYGPAWPHEREPDFDHVDGDARFKTKKTEYQKNKEESLKCVAAQTSWPEERSGLKGKERPLINLLFSGGVFRGVFQMGVLNALSEVAIKPDLIAGASVGSMTGAMVAEALSKPKGKERDDRIARLAATYLAVDRLVMTDRFADFVRTLTVHGASTRFSFRQADRFFRRYDKARSGKFGREARLVLAGIERLFYVSPFELEELVRAARERKGHVCYTLLREHTQELLDRMGVGIEVLGAEPLQYLIREHVTGQISTDGADHPGGVRFDAYLKDGIYMLATATNLTAGRLEILGEQQFEQRKSATLMGALLASSAFPGVFRPRRSWEVMPATDSEHLYIDGGVMDNLPLDAVAEFLWDAARKDAGLIAKRPKVKGSHVPHLVFAASLQVTPPPLTPEQRDALAHNWPALWGRARRLSYNKKLEIYAKAQRQLRKIHENKSGNAGEELLDLEVVTVRPRWLCSTFGFHPMLGFRRAKQAESIAHGCASTLLKLAGIRDSQDRPKVESWGIDASSLPPNGFASENEQFKPRDYGEDKCWFRPDADCPFSRSRLRDRRLGEETMRELEGIYRACGQPKTHESR